MGLSVVWIGVRAPVGDARSATIVLEAPDLTRFCEAGGWVWASGWTSEPINHLMARAARSVREPTIAGWVFDSDFAYLTATDDKGETRFELAIKEPYSDDAFSRRLAGQWRSAQLRMEAAARVSGWSADYAPRELTVSAVVRALEDDEDTPIPGSGPVFAEDAVRAIFEDLGLPNPDDTIFSVEGD